MSANSSEFSWSIMSEIKRQNVRRCLFERPDPEKQRADLKLLNKKLSEPGIKRLREKWSFDPETGPLDTGRYEFIPLDPFCPSFYMKGYSCNKSKPAQLVRDNLCLAQCHIGIRGIPISAKRKLDLSDKDENNHSNTNSENVENVNKCLLHGIDSKPDGLSASVTHVADVDDKVCGDLYHSSVGLTRPSTVPTLPELSPTSRVKEIMTPTPVQSSMKDYLPAKKQRTNNTKTLPRT